MTALEALREAAQEPSKLGSLAYEMMLITEQFNNQLMSRDEFEYLVKEIANVKAAQHLADDENASRWIVSVASALVSVA
jgi:hypothetical protein